MFFFTALMCFNIAACIISWGCRGLR